MTGSDSDQRPVLSIGELLIDLIASDGATRLQDVSSFAARPGGAPANAAVALARLGVPSAFCGVVGDDPFGDRLLTTLAGYQVDASRVRMTTDADTTFAFAWKDGRGDGHFRLIRLADRLLTPNDVEAAGIETGTALVVGSVALAAEPARSAIVRAAEIATASGVPLCFDVNLRPTIWPDIAAARAACEPLMRSATVLKLSLDDARHLFDVEAANTALDRLSTYNAPFVVLTDGARGAWFVQRDRVLSNEERYVPAFSVDAVDPTGAGDAFTAAVIARLVSHDWQELARNDIVFAAAAGGLATTRRGAMDALPTLADVEDFLAERQVAVQ